MKAIDRLQNLYFLHKVGVGDYSDCIEWAVERLQLNQEGDDLDVVLLAAATDSAEALPFIETIIVKYIGHTSLDEQLAAGKYIVTLYQAYQAGRETITSLDEKFTKLYSSLGYPNWLVMLSRNCEYATDVPVFLQPFEEEFKYIAKLWANSKTRNDFEAQYRREVSNQHDINKVTKVKSAPLSLSTSNNRE